MNLKSLKLSFIFLFCWSISYSQCDTTKITKNNWSITSFSSEELTGEGANGHAVFAIDSDTLTYWHSQWQAQQANYPHEIVVDLGMSYPVNGISLLSRHNGGSAKTKAFKIFLSQDGLNWGSQQVDNEMQYANVNLPSQRCYSYFGAVNAQYVKIIITSNYENNPYIVVSEIDVYQYAGAGCVATGQQNQFINLTSIPKKETNSVSFPVIASASSSLPITFSIVSGPATILGNMITLTGNSGTVVVKASQVGDVNYYSNSKESSFSVIDLLTFYPNVTSKLTDAFPLQMPTLSPYLFYASATIPEPDFLNVQSVEYEIDGQVIPSTFKNGSYQAWWTPNSFGSHIVYVRAIGSNNNIDEDTINLIVSSSIANQNVNTFVNGVIDMGTIGSQWYYGSYKLPQSVGAYDTIIANFSISCPNVAGGCDDWDRLGWIEYKAPNGEWYELIRYITPYGVPCHQSLNVTDYASLLQGNIELRMYIETWGTGGWKLNLNFDYKEGTPPFKYSTIQEVWDGDYSFGNPSNLQPVETYKAFFGNDVSASKLRMVTTGHGWGANNTSNAAEFYHAIHNIKVNNINTYQQDLWQSCNPNPASCTGQNGTWQYNRAGWCPGSMGKTFEYDLNSLIAQDSVELNYEFQTSYKDLCHPNNPNCVSGQTCADCNAGYNPYYHVGAYQINFSNNPIELSTDQIDSEIENNILIFPNPSKGKFYMDITNEINNFNVNIFDVTGNLLKVYYFENKEQLYNYPFDISNFNKGYYFIKIQNQKFNFSSKLILE